MTKKIHVILLALVITLPGCLSGDETVEEGTTIIHDHYYNNTTDAPQITHHHYNNTTTEGTLITHHHYNNTTTEGAQVTHYNTTEGAQITHHHYNNTTTEGAQITHNTYNNTTNQMQQPLVNTSYVMAAYGNGAEITITTQENQVIEILDVWVAHVQTWNGGTNNSTTLHEGSDHDGWSASNSYNLETDISCSTFNTTGHGVGPGSTNYDEEHGVESTSPDGSTDWLPTDGGVCEYQIGVGYYDGSGPETLFVIYKVHELSGHASFHFS